MAWIWPRVIAWFGEGGVTKTTTGSHGDRIKLAVIWPAFLLVLVITLFLLIYALMVSFQTVRIVPPRCVGLDNSTEILASPRLASARFRGR